MIVIVTVTAMANSNMTAAAYCSILHCVYLTYSISLFTTVLLYQISLYLPLFNLLSLSLTLFTTTLLLQISLYEHVILESLETNERDLAREILRTTEPMAMLKIDQPERYLKLEHLCQRPFFNSSDAYEMGSSKEKRSVA